MNIARRGKIARLSDEIRRQVNERLRNGEPGKRIVVWLNSLPEVQSVMQHDFDGKAVREQNLSEWRQGGYTVWLEQQEALEMATPVAEDLKDLAETAGGPITDQMAIWLSVRYLMAARKRENAGENAESDWRRLREFCLDLSALRRGDYYAERLKLEREKMAFTNHDELEQALFLCLELSRKFPDVMQSFRASFKLLKEHLAPNGFASGLNVLDPA